MTAFLLFCLLLIGVHSITTNPYLVGTKLFHYNDGLEKWQNGEITTVEGSTIADSTSGEAQFQYQIEWEDGTIEFSSKYSDQELHDMAENFEVLWPVKTSVYLEENSTIKIGAITNLSKYGDYIITWNTGDIDTDKYTDEQIDKMVKDFLLHKGLEDQIPVGTRVYLYDQQSGKWSEGQITAWSNQFGYSIEWEDESVEIGKYSEDQMNEMVENYKNKQVAEQDASTSVPPGTGVYTYDPEYNAWYEGTVTKWSPQLGYTIMWEDEATEVAEYTHQEVQQMALNFMNKKMIDPGTVLLPFDSKLLQQFADGSSRTGSITSWTPMEGYTIKWSDLQVEVGLYTVDQIQDMINTYKVVYNDHWPIGTKVYHHKENGAGWMGGIITKWNVKESYTILWNDGSVDVGAYTDDEITEMVKHSHLLNAIDSPYLGPGFEIGTPVFYDYNNEWYEGKITDYDPDKGYTITWSNGSVDVNKYTKEELERMIYNWKSKRPSSTLNEIIHEGSSFWSGVGIFCLVVALAAPLVFAMKSYTRKRRENPNPPLSHIDKVTFEEEEEDNDDEEEVWAYYDRRALSTPKVIV